MACRMRRRVLRRAPNAAREASRISWDWDRERDTGCRVYVARRRVDAVWGRAYAVHEQGAEQVQ